MSRPIYCHGPIIILSEPYILSQFHICMTFKPFRALCLAGVSSCCFDLYAPMTCKLMENERNRLEKRVDLRPKCFNWPYLRQRPIKRKIHFKVSSFRMWSWKPQRTSCSDTKHVWSYATDLLWSVRCEPSKCGCGSVEQLWSLFSHDSKACFFLVSSLIMNHDVSTSLQRKQLGRLFDR